MTTENKILFLILFTFRITSSHNKPVSNNRMPIMMKSEGFQLTSAVNCIAINGIEIKYSPYCQNND